MKILPRKLGVDKGSAGRVSSPALQVDMPQDPRYTHVLPPHPDPEWMSDAKFDVQCGLREIAQLHDRFMEFKDGRLMVKR